VTVTEALKTLQSAPHGAPSFRGALACGFTPLHLQTFLAAHLQRCLPDRHVSIVSGLFGDLAGTLEGLLEQDVDAVAVLIEWPDLDSRLSYRESGAWGTASVADIVPSIGRMLERLHAALERLTRRVRVAVSVPTLSLPPIFHTPGWQASSTELSITRDLAQFAAGLSSAYFVNPSSLAENSTPDRRYDLKSDLFTGFPYAVPHADALASALARLLAPGAPKKGLITDLDDTLWDGIVGEAGPEGVAWDLASHRQVHGIYQRLLSSLSERGVLVGVASKNDPAVVEQTFARRDILLRPERVFPIEVHWGPKSASVQRIRKAWNIGADSIVFVDDSPLELAEVAAAHPGIECIQFPKNDYSAALQMFRRLRDLFGKERISKEDAIRADSLRQAAVFEPLSESGSAPEEFLAGLNAAITFELQASGGLSRALELVNKTNQFNLNGVRYTDADWSCHLSQPGVFVAVVVYEDKFGPLGRIGVLLGSRRNQAISLRSWVMSCRAFARRIEHASLRMLFDHLDARRVEFEYAATPRNGPLRETLEFYLGSELIPPVSLSLERFDELCPALYHKIEFA
jgi:FkbH-like protein